MRIVGIMAREVRLGDYMRGGKRGIPYILPYHLTNALSFNSISLKPPN
jgi:hypothetical protein